MKTHQRTRSRLRAKPDDSGWYIVFAAPTDPTSGTRAEILAIAYHDGGAPGHAWQRLLSQRIDTRTGRVEIQRCRVVYLGDDPDTF